MQKRSQKLQSLQDKKRNYIKEACACEEEMRNVFEEVEERRVRLETLSEKSGNCRRQQMIWKTKSRSCKQGNREEAAVRCGPTDVALIQPWWSRSLACGAALTEHFTQAPASPGDEREDWEGDWDDEKAASG